VKIDLKYADINAKLQELNRSRADLTPEALKRDNQVIPHHSFSLKCVDFDKIRLAISPFTKDDGEDIAPHVGFCPTSKRGYQSWIVTPDQAAKILEMCQQLILNPTLEATTGLFDYLQTCKIQSSAPGST
jgi:hypothetical protein